MTQNRLDELERRMGVAERFIADRHHDLADLTKRLAAFERRHAQHVETFATELNAIKDRLHAMDEGDTSA